jgi:hypothetical protein
LNQGRLVVFNFLKISEMHLLRKELFKGEKTLVRALVLGYVFLRLIFFLVIYLLSGINGQIRYPAIGVALAYANDPARAVAAFILPISAMLNISAIWLRLRRIRFLLHAPSHWVTWGTIVIMLGLHSLGLFGLGAVTPATNVALSYVVGAFWYGGAVSIIVLTTILNLQVGLKQPRYLVLYRRILAAIIVAVSIGIAVTIGWVIGASSILEIIMGSMTALYSLSYMHECEFPMRSHCPFAYPATVPPVPKNMPEHAELLVKEVD